MPGCATRECGRGFVRTGGLRIWQVVVARFGETLREEVNLDQLCEQVVLVVQETMQPTYLSLWLRPSERSATTQHENAAFPS